MKLLFVRHGATPGNEAHRYVGSTDEPLSEAGILALKTIHYPPVERVWCSPMLRARQTAELFWPNQTPVMVPDLREYDFGETEGKTWEELNDPTVYDRWQAEEPDACFPGGERLRDFYARTAHGAETVVTDAWKQGVPFGAVVAHGGVIMSILRQLGVPKRGYYDYQLSNGGAWLVEVSSEEELCFSVIKRY